MTAPTAAAVGARLDQVQLQLRQALAELAELERHAPGQVAAVVAALVGHLRSWRPESVSPLGLLAPPTEPIRDPRGDVP